MRQTSVAAVAITTLIYALISLGSYLVFGRGTQSDVLHNYTPTLLQHIAPHWLAETLYIVVRLSFLLGVLTLFPLMVRFKVFSEICASSFNHCQTLSRKEILCAVVYADNLCKYHVYSKGLANIIHARQSSCKLLLVTSI